MIELSFVGTVMFIDWAKRMGLGFSLLGFCGVQHKARG